MGAFKNQVNEESLDFETQIRALLERLDSWSLEPQRGSDDPKLESHLYPYTHLFSPIQVNGITIKNRIVMGPMGNINIADEMGRPSQKMIEYFTERARGGAGMIASGLIPVSQGVDPSVTEPGDRSLFPRIDGSRTVLSGWRTLAENVHAYGAHFFIQLTPGLGRVGSPECLLNKRRLPVSASWNPNFYMPAIPCRPLTDAECRKIIRRCGQAAADARSVLIDGIYLHGHEGYLLEQMTNPAFNRRKIGRFANWMNFGLDLVKEVRKRTGPKTPIWYRIDLSLALNAAYGSRMDTVRSLRLFKRERSVAQTLAYMQRLVQAGVDLFDVDLGSYDNWWLPHPPNSSPSGCYLPVAKLVKDAFIEMNVRSNAGLPVPVVAVGKLGYPDLAEKALRENQCDMIMLARPLLADPEWPQKAFAGRVEEIVPCIGDQEACMNEFLEGGHPQCAVNPRTGFEYIYDRTPALAQRRKRIAVVGAGPAGIQCAVTAARRGHQVTLFEKQDCIGGMLVPGSTPRIKYEVRNYLNSLRGMFELTARECGLELRLSEEAGPDLLRREAFEAVVLCHGAIPATPPAIGVGLPHVVQAVDVFRNPGLADGVETVVVIGGGSVGCECAQFLAYELGKRVTVVEMLPAIMKGVCTANRHHLIRLLEKKGVQLLNCTRLERIDADAVTVTRNVSKTVPDPYITWAPLLPENVTNPLARPIREELEMQALPAGLVVLATGLVPDQRLYEAFKAGSGAAELYRIGDAFQVGRVFEAVKAGYAVGRTI